MPEAANSTQQDLKLPRAFVVGFLIWMIPAITCFLLGNATFRQLVYGGLWVSFLYTMALSIICLVYRAASNRGLSLKVATLLSLAATIPAMKISYLVDFAVVRWDPSLATIPQPNQTLLSTLATALADSLASATLLAAIVFLPLFARANEERNQEIRGLSREAELLRYRANLEPHFVLNSLHAVAGLVEEDPLQARELLAALGDLFRDATAFQPMHRVSDEIEWIKRYVTIHELRHPQLLHASWDLAPEALAHHCPALLLQPLVENAVKHGALRGGGHLLIRAVVEQEQLLLSVEDDGPGLSIPREGGRGLEIIRRRLALEGLKTQAFELVREGAQTVARIRLPLRSGAIHA